MGVLEAQAQPLEILKKKKHNFSFCLNTSTIRQQNLGLVGEIKTAAKVGFNGIEIWMRTLEAYVKEGGKLADIRKLAQDLSITIEDSIGFAAWIVDDDGNPAVRATRLPGWYYALLPVRDDRHGNADRRINHAAELTLRGSKRSDGKAAAR